MGEGDSWPALIVVTSKQEQNFGGNIYFYKLNLKDLYTGDEEYLEGKYNEVTVDDTEFVFVTALIKDPIAEAGGSVLEFGEEVGNLVDNFKKNAVGTICTLLLDLLRTICDGIQIIINMIRTSTLHRGLDFRLAYTYEELHQDYENGKAYENANEEEKKELNASAGTRDSYTDVKEIMKYGTGYEEDWQKGPIEIDGNKYGFTMETEIPVIPMDIYNLSVGNISFLDVNFLTGNEYHDDNSPWMIIRNVAVAIIHITIYLSMAVLITSLIWHGIHIVKGSIDNPQARAEHKQGLKRFCTSLLMIVGTIVIMALCIFANNMFLGDLRAEKDELPIRVSVNMPLEPSGGYSFSTNFTGYVRYMSQIEDVDMYGEKATYVFSYLGLVIVNLLGSLVMLVRMILMLILAIVGPIIAAVHAIRNESIGAINFNTWVKLYVSLAAIQIFFAIVCRIILECAIS